MRVRVGLWIAVAAVACGDDERTMMSSSSGPPGTSGPPPPMTTTGGTLPEVTSTTSGVGTGSTTGFTFDVAEIPDAGDNDTDGPVDESTCAAAAMSLTSAGCLFAPVVMQVSGNLPWAVVAANTNVAQAGVTLYANDGSEIESAMIAPGDLHTFVFDAGGPEYTAHNIPENTTIEARALRLESDIPIVAYQFSPYSSSQQATSDASLLLPYHAWGQDYIVGAYHNTDLSNSWVTIISFDDDNDVDVTASDYMGGSTAAGAGGIPALAAGESFSETLQDGEVLRVLSPSNGSADLTGMRITSDRPVSVFSGAPSMSIPGPGMEFYKDHLEETQPPRVAWGNDYAVVHFRPRSDESDVYRFIADEDGTTITLSGDYADVLTLDEGEFAEVQTPESFFASSPNAFAVFHYMVSQSLTSGPKDDVEYPGDFLSPNCSSPSQVTTELGDPATSWFPPVEQYRYNYGFLTPETYAWDMVTVIAPMNDWNTISLDGGSLPEDPTALGVGGWGYARFLIEDGPHYIASASTKFGLEVYGYDCRVSYAYPGGLSLAAINPPPEG